MDRDDSATSGDAQWDASSRPPRPSGPVGAGPDRPTPPVGAGTPGTRDDAPAWLFADDDPGPQRRPHRRNLLLAVSILPWLAALVWFLRPDLPPARTPASLPADDPTHVAGQDRTVRPEPIPTASGTPPTPDPSPGRERLPAGGGARTAVTLADATSLAVIAARDWLGGLGPRTEIYDAPLLEAAYVDQIAVEAVDHPGPGHVVVTLLAMVLHSEDGDFDRAELVRLAVPVAVDGAGARPAGTPWLLTPPHLELSTPAAHELDDPTLVPEAVAALERAGYREVEVTTVLATDGWPFVVTVEAVAPGAAAAERHVVWLRPHGNEFVLAGERPAQEETP